MSGRGRSRQTKQSTISAFFKSACGTVSGGFNKLTEEASGHAPSNEDNTRPAKKRRLSDANASKASYRPTNESGAATKQGRGRARSYGSGSEVLNIDCDSAEAVIDLQDAVTSSEHEADVQVDDEDFGTAPDGAVGDSRLDACRVDRDPIVVKATTKSASISVKNTVTTDGDGQRRLLASRRRSAVAEPSTVTDSRDTAQKPPLLGIQNSVKHPKASATPYTSKGKKLDYGGECGAPACRDGAYGIASKDTMTPQQRKRAQFKLAQEYSGRVSVDLPTTSAVTTDGTRATVVNSVKLTPLEQQVVELRAGNPGTLLVVEVGYKMRFFGEDAEIAARVCNLWAHMEHNFLTASFPVYRLPVYVRRLCRAGYRVGVVRQTETAAIKAAGANKSAPFERKVTALYTAATMEAARRADKIGEEDALDELQDAIPLQTGGSASILVLSELPPPGNRQQQCQFNQETGVLGVLCLDLAGGDIVYGMCGENGASGGGSPVDAGASTAAGPRPAAAAAEDLEALLIATTPVEVVTVGPPLLAATKRLLMNYLSSAPACRLEHIPPPLVPAPRSGSDDIALHHQEGEKDAEEQRQLLSPQGRSTACKGSKAKGSRFRAAYAFEAEAAAGYGDETAAEPAATQSPSGYAAASGHVAARWVAAARQELEAFFTEDVAPAPNRNGSVHSTFVASLPPAIALATWGALRHLQPFGLTAVLRVSRCWRPLSRRVSAVTDGVTAPLTPFLQEMALGPNALRQLAIVSSAEGSDSSVGGEDTLLGLMDRTHTAFGSRLLRQWLVRPLCRRELILRRQEGVSEILEAGQSGAAPLCHVSKALSRLTDVERGVTRALHGTASPAEFVATVHALQQFRADIGLQPLPDLPEDFPDDCNNGDSANDGTAAFPRNESNGGGGGDGESSGATAGATAALASLQSRVRSPLLRLLLRKVASQSLAAKLAAVLQLLDTKAAAANDFSAMFVDRQRFSGVWAAKDAVRAAEEHLQSLIPSLARAVGLPSLSYVNIQNQGSYLVEVPVDAEKRVPQSWHKVCSTKKFHRYHPPDVAAGLQDLGVARERLAAAQYSAWSSFLTAFAPIYPFTLAAVRAAAQLDVLSALAALAATPGYCRPDFLPDDPEQQNARVAERLPGERIASRPTSVLRARDARHPMLDARLNGALPSKLGGGSGGIRPGGGGGVVVPNDVELDGRSGGCRCLIVTGPNMGGKSCYTRTAALLVVMAQVGSYVPATALELTVFDGVYTRMGASDNLLLGRSTFFEEMSDASAVLAAATPQSLVVLDELGRGTATHDGVAVAEAVLHHLISVTRCLVLFVTHYPQLSRAVNVWPCQVKACHMSYLREDNCEEESDVLERKLKLDVDISDASGAADALGEDEARDNGLNSRLIGGRGSMATWSGRVPRITFLYKLEESAADESFGLNVAQMAGLPSCVIQRAAEIARCMRQRQEGVKGAEEEVKKLARHNPAPDATYAGEGSSVEGEQGWQVSELRTGLDATQISQQELVSLIRRVAEVICRLHQGDVGPGGGGHIVDRVSGLKMVGVVADSATPGSTLSEAATGLGGAVHCSGNNTRARSDLMSALNELMILQLEMKRRC